MCFLRSLILLVSTVYIADALVLSNTNSTQIAHSRQRRFIVPFTKGSSLTVTFGLAMPIPTLTSTSTVVSVLVPFKFNLPTTDDLQTLFGRTWEEESRFQRSDIYQQLEAALSSYGIDGKSCVLRTLCEVSETPIGGGLFGEIFNLIFKSHDEMNFSDNDIYDQARNMGQKSGNCHKTYSSCPFSLFSQP